MIRFYYFSPMKIFLFSSNIFQYFKEIGLKLLVFLLLLQQQHAHTNKEIEKRERYKTQSSRQRYYC